MRTYAHHDNRICILREAYYAYTLRIPTVRELCFREVFLPLHSPATCGQEESQQSKEAVILHPGSTTLYLGFASDSIPLAVPHILAYKTTALAAAGKPPEESRDRDIESRDVGVSCEQGTQSCGSRRVKEDPSLVLEYEVDMTVSSYLPLQFLTFSASLPSSPLQSYHYSGKFSCGTKKITIFANGPTAAKSPLPPGK